MGYDEWKLASPDTGEEKEVDVHIVASVFRSDLDIYVNLLSKELYNEEVETTELTGDEYDEGWYKVEAWGARLYEFFDDDSVELALEELENTLKSYADIELIEQV